MVTMKNYETTMNNYENYEKLLFKLYLNDEKQKMKFLKIIELSFTLLLPSLI